MTFERFMVTPVTIQRAPTASDEYGNQVLDWASAASVETTGWLTQLQLQTLSSENRDRQDTLRSAWRLFLRSTETIGGFDRVLADGATFEVDGHPLMARTPGGAHHIEVELRLVE